MKKLIKRERERERVKFGCLLFPFIEKVKSGTLAVSFFENVKS